MMLPAQVALLVSLASSSGLRVETTTPDALCPELGQVRAAVSARLGAIEAAGEWLASYALVHRPDADAGDVVRLELYDPGGRLRLRRDLPRAGESCTAVAQALVVVLDSYFRHPADADADADADAGGGGPSTSAVAERAAPPAPAPGAPLALALDVGGAFAAGPRSPALAIDLRLGLRSGWTIGLHAAWLVTEQEQRLAAATASLASYAFRGSFTRRLRPGRAVDVLVGPEVLYQLDRARIPGARGGTGGLRGGWGAGVRGQLQLRLGPRVGASMYAAADYAPPDLSGYFEAETMDGAPFMPQIFPPSRLRVLVGVGVSVVLLQ
jgi:hypothetical protein